MGATVDEVVPTAYQDRWLEKNGAAALQRVLGQRFGLTPQQRVQVINNKSLVRDLAGIVLRQHDLRDGMLLDVDMRGADCRTAHLSNVLIQCADAEAGDFRLAQLDQVFFWKSRVCDASFDHAFLHDVTFEESPLTGASFVHAALRGVHFHSLDLTGCDFDGTQFVDCNFFDVRIDRRHRALLEGAGHAACRLSRVTWVVQSVQPAQFA